jgi:hypothetical protein
VFSTDGAVGSFSWGDTGVERVYDGVAGFPEPIYRLVFTSKKPVVLPAGIYWFSHDASIKAVAADVNGCKNMGWQALMRENLTGFKNQGDCIQYVNTGK